MKPWREMTAKEAYQTVLRCSMMVTSPSEQIREADRLLAQNTVQAELGTFSDEQLVYHLDEVTRDRLIVHGRQDARHAVLVAFQLSSEVKALARLVV